MRDTRSSMIAGDRLSVACDLPYLGRQDHPDGIRHLPEDGEDRFLVVYEPPTPERLEEKENRTPADAMAFET